MRIGSIAARCRSRPEDGDSDFYVIAADTPEDIQAKLLRVVTERIPAALWPGPDP